MAAGLGFKTFNTGDVLSATDVNGYLMQGVLVFASAAARNAAITSPQEGQFAFTKDTNGLWYYDGAAWVASGATGDIEGVTAGVGISGGGTSGTVTVTNDMATTITASGDIVVGTGSGTYDNLPIGTTNQILTADTTVSPYKVKWATPASSGGMTVIATGSLSGTSVTISSIPQTYVNLQLVISGATWATTYAQFAFRYNGSSGGSSYKTYLNGAYGTSASVQSTYEWSEISSYNRVYINGEWDYTGGLNNQTITFENYTINTYPVIRYEASYKNNLGYITFANGVFTTNDSSAVSQIQMLNTGSLSFGGGTYTLYGVK
jgi:hypothetical protein